MLLRVGGAAAATGEGRRPDTDAYTEPNAADLPMPFVRACLAIALLLLAGCRESASPAAPGAGTPPAAPPAAAPAVATPGAGALQGRVAAHWFGRHWPKNYLAAFRRDEVAGDFRRLAEDGFDTVVLLVAWGDFQPVPDPCCRWDERAFERLRFLVDEAERAGLKVMLRLGYGWSFHPDFGDVGHQQHRLMNEPAVREAWFAFLRRVAGEIDGRGHVVLSFMSWEDQWLHRIEESARADYDAFAATRGLPPGSPLPDKQADAALFHGYWDWLVIERLYRPALALFPALSYEARVDREPRFAPGPDGQPAVVEWLAHEGMYRLPEGQALTVYWAPFWGAQNRGEQLPAARSLELLGVMLDEARTLSGGRDLFVDQFNFVDNTPGHETNAVLRPEETPAFLHAAACVMRARHVLGYGLWTTRDYAESPLHNPAFGYGLEGWTLARADGGAPEAALVALPSGDFEVRLAAGDVLAQAIPPTRGRLPRRDDAMPDRICIDARADGPARLDVRAGGPAVQLAFAAGGGEACADIAPVPGASGLALELRLAAGTLAVRDVLLFDHVQYGGLYDRQGRPASLLGPVQRMNRDFRADPLPARCSSEP